MIRLEPIQWEQIFTIGKEKYQIDVESGSLRSVGNLYQKIAETKEEEINALLDNQLKATKHKNTFLIVFQYNNTGRSVLDIKKREICTNWFITNCEFKGLYFSQIMDSFYDFRKKNPSKIEEWKLNLYHFIDGKDSKIIIPFLKFGLGMLNDGFTLHKMICTNFVNCPTDITFENKIDYCNSLLEKIQEVKQKNNSENQSNISTKNNASTTYNKTQWLGTQKQLAELFIELKEKGWIEKFEPDAIDLCFTNAKTIGQILKPNYDNKEPFYDQVYTTMYSPIFRQIKENTKSKK